MTKHFKEFSGYAGALNCLEKIGGQLFPGKGRDSSHTVNCGGSSYTFWEPNSKRYQQCRLLAEDVSFPHEHFTAGRIAKHIIENVCGINPKEGYPEKRFIQLAQDGFHWHYTHVETGYHPYLLEFDLCAAYATSLGQFDGIYFQMNPQKTSGHMEMENLRVALASVPKWMRMILVGQMAAHRMTFATMPNRKEGSVALKWQTIRSIKYGGAFNRTHQAILRVYRLLEAIHERGGDSIKRIHTDSFSLSADCPTDVEASIFGLLDDKGFSYSVKAQGTSHFFDLNSGIVGRKFVGVPFEIREQLRALPSKPRRVFITPEQLERWGVRGVQDDTKVQENEGRVDTYSQLSIEGLNVTRTPENPSRFA